MIVTGVLQLCASVINGALSLITSFVSIPTDLFSVLGTITGFGSYIIGSDLLYIFVSSVMFWTTLKLTLGVLVFIWELLPLT